MDHLPLSTFTITVQGFAVIIKTFALHFIKKKEITEAVPARGDILFDEAFCLVKHFFERASLSTVEELQKFGNNFTPAPFDVRVIKITIPLSTRLDAGRILIDTLGEKEVKEIIGGREWWQRTLQEDGGVNGEWISMKSDWNGLDNEAEIPPQEDEVTAKIRLEKLNAMKARAEAKEKELKKKVKGKGKDREKDGTEMSGKEGENVETEESYSPEMDYMKCTLAIHGGGAFFGSINTHRYVFWRLARKTSGRVFAVQYRLAPQWPFPCALADALSAYLYLIRPPVGAKHRPVDPAKLSLVGDSAGGNICLALLCLIRDAGLPAPAGAVLISPWCDLTHSFPSILTNTKTDVVPPYGFLFKPSTLWPPPPPEFQERANTSTSLPHLKEIYLERQEEKRNRKASSFLSFGRNSTRREKSTRSNIREREVAARKGEELADATEENTKESNPNETDPQKAEAEGEKKEQEGTGEVAEVLKVKIDGEEVAIDSQIQLYATNDQLVYPFVSPIWQPSLGGLPPLFVLAGEKEVLRDEIVYMAHRAANPELYPIRQALLDANPERTRIAKTYGPTKVHLQIYDDSPHDLPLFSFTTPAKFAYRAMSSFINFVTAPEGEISLSTPPPPPTSTPSKSSKTSTPSSTLDSTTSTTNTNLYPPSRTDSFISSIFQSSSSKEPRSSNTSSSVIGLESTIYSSGKPLNRPPYVENMIRERVAIDGVVRLMEPIDQVEILKLNPEEIGLIREGPVKRYLAGKALWDKRFKKAYLKVQKRREHHLKKSMSEETDRIRKRVEKSRSDSSNSSNNRRVATMIQDENDNVRSSSPEPIESIEGIWNLHGERPPPSSIAARKDTSEARKLAHVLDTHYAYMHSLHLWTGVNDVAECKTGRQDSQQVEKS